MVNTSLMVLHKFSHPFWVIFPLCRCRVSVKVVIDSLRACHTTLGVSIKLYREGNQTQLHLASHSALLNDRRQFVTGERHRLDDLWPSERLQEMNYTSDRKTNQGSFVNRMKFWRNFFFLFSFFEAMDFQSISNEMLFFWWIVWIYTLLIEKCHFISHLLRRTWISKLLLVKCWD